MVAVDQQYMEASIHDRLHGDCRRISAMLNNLIAYLRRSPLKGPKYAAPKIPKDLQTMLNKYLPKA